MGWILANNAVFATKFLWSGAPLVIVDGSDFLTTEHRDRVLEEGRRLAGDDAVTMLRRSTAGGLSWSPRWDDRYACVQDLQIRSWIRVGELEVVNAVREVPPLVIGGAIEVPILSAHFPSSLQSNFRVSESQRSSRSP